MTILAVVTDETAGDWVARARQVTLRAVSDEVDWVLGQAAATGQWQDLKPPPLGSRLEEPAPRQICAPPPPGEVVDSQVAFSGPVSVIAAFRIVVRALAGRTHGPWCGLERLLDHFDREWTRPELEHDDPMCPPRRDRRHPGATATTRTSGPRPGRTSRGISTLGATPDGPYNGFLMGALASATLVFGLYWAPLIAAADRSIQFFQG